MTQAYEVVQRNAQPALAVATRAGTMKLPFIMGKAFHLAWSQIKAQGLEMTGAPYTLYKNIDWQRAQAKGLKALLNLLTFKWDLEIGIPANATTAGPGLVLTEVPAGRYLKGMHHGPYHKVGQTTYMQMLAYATQQRLELGDHAMEVYLNDPKETPQEQLLTEVYIALR